MAEHQEGVLAMVSEQLSTLSSRFVHATPAPQNATVTSPVSTPVITTSSMPIQLARPDKFSGDCCPFLMQCELHFELQAQMFPTERAKIAYLISHLTGRAEAWVTAEWTRRTMICVSFSDFSRAFTQIFQSFSPGREAARSLMSLRQGRRSVLDYAIEFQTLAANSGWNSSALTDTFLSGLSQRIKDQLISLDLPDDLDNVIAVINKIDRHLQDHDRERTDDAPAPTMIKTEINPSEPMQLGRARLSLEEKETIFTLWSAWSYSGHLSGEGMWLTSGRATQLTTVTLLVQL